MAEIFGADFKAAVPNDAETSNDPIANAFAQYKQFAHLRCSPPAFKTGVSRIVSKPTTSTDASKPKSPAAVSSVNVTKKPNLILTKWIDSSGVVRTRNRRDPTSREFFAKMHTQRWKREMQRAFDLIVNKDDIREHLLLNGSTVQALRDYVTGNWPEFLSAVLMDRLITSDMLVRISRGPIFEEWMIKQLIFDAVMKSAVDFNKGTADNAVAATSHFIANNGMVVGREAIIGHEIWESESEHGIEKYFNEVDASTTSCNIFTLFNQIILQFATPANIGTSSVEDLIARAGLAYAIILQAATRAVEQLVRDSNAHAAKVSLDVSVIFAAITLGASITPSPYVALVVDSVEGVIQTVISNYVNQPVNAIQAVASNLNDQFSNYILKPALAGDSVPGLFPVSTTGAGAEATPTSQPNKTQEVAGGKMVDASAAAPTPTLTAAGKRRQLGQLFQSKYQDYIGMLDTVHTPMQKI